ncbi:MAG: hypothetical protein H7311_05990, partial [Ramlibacter sp.]|nr:hypothetical protein [Cryobacterium sp.]
MSKTDSDDDFTEFAGTVFWPRGTADLTDTTRCPACHSQLHSPVCSNCALDLRHPAAALLLTASTDAAASLSHRTALIGRIRFDVAEAQAQAADLVASRAPLAASVPESAPVSVPVAMRMPPPAAQAPAPALTPRAQRPPSAPGAGATVSVPGAPRRSSVQILLLLVGVTLVSVAAIFFLTVAWIYAGLEVRSAIIALITAAALVTAGVLRRKRLVATAEGIGALAVVLVLLDAWALRQNDLFGLASADGPAYWGVTLVSCTVLFLFWHAVSGLRVASVAGFAAAAPGLGLLAAGLAAGQDGTTRLFVGLLGAAVGALLHPLTLPRGTADGSTGARPGPTSTTPAAPVPHRFWPAVDRVPERAAILVLGGMALVGAALTATVVAPDSTLAPLVTLGAVTVAALLHQLPFVQRATPGSAYAAFASGCAALTALALTAITPLVAYRADNLTLALTVPILVAVSIPLAVEVYARRRSA